MFTRAWLRFLCTSCLLINIWTHRGFKHFYKNNVHINVCGSCEVCSFYCQMLCSVLCKDHFSCRIKDIVQLYSINEVSGEFKFEITGWIEIKSSSIYSVHVYGASLVHVYGMRVALYTWTLFNVSQQMNELVVDRLVPLSSCTDFIYIIFTTLFDWFCWLRFDRLFRLWRTTTRRCCLCTGTLVLPAWSLRILSLPSAMCRLTSLHMRSNWAGTARTWPHTSICCLKLPGSWDSRHSTCRASLLCWVRGSSSCSSLRVLFIEKTVIQRVVLLQEITFCLMRTWLPSTGACWDQNTHWLLSRYSTVPDSSLLL